VSLRVSPVLLLAGGMLLSVLVYLPGLGGEFMFDDHWNIVNNQSLHIDSPVGLVEAAGSGVAGPLKRPLAMTSFALNHLVSGLEPAGWKIANLAIHLLTGWLVFLVCRELVQALVERDEAVRAEWVAAVVATLWLLHPLNLTAVLYVVQRMTSLAALFSLWAIYLYLRGRVQLGGGGWRYIYVSIALALPLALLSKETGALVPVLLLLIEWVCFRFEAPPEHRRRLFKLFGIIVGLPALVVAAVLLFSPDTLLGGYASRSFTLGDRLLTEPRVLWFYVQLTFLPRLSALGLFHDDFIVSTTLLSPATTLPAILAWGLLVIFALTRFCPRVVAFGLLFFLVGHGLESTIFPLELVFEHRNYLPMVGLLLPPVYYLVVHGIPGLATRLPAVLLCLFTLWLGFTTALRASDWRSLASFSVAQYQYHPESARSAYQLGRIHAALVDQVVDSQERGAQLERAAQLFASSAELRPEFTDGLFGLLVLYSRNGLEPTEGMVEELLVRLREQPLNSNTLRQIENLVACYGAGECVLDPGLLERIRLATLSNPGISERMRQVLES
jgi:hypothetical protein